MKGLAARRVKVNGRSQLGFPRAAVEKFVAEHKDLVEKGARFSHLTDAEKDEILRLARELRDSGGTLTEVSKQIATRLGRSPEAVRYTIKNFDRGHPDQRPVPGRGRPADRRGQGTDLCDAPRLPNRTPNPRGIPWIPLPNDSAARGPACTGW